MLEVPRVDPGPAAPRAGAGAAIVGPGHGARATDAPTAHPGIAGHADAAGGGGDGGVAGGSARARGGAPGGDAVALAVPGTGGGAPPAEYRVYYDDLRRLIRESLRYPPSARRRGLSGTVELEVEVRPTGTVGSVAIVRSSSHRELDDAALDAVRGLPRMPFPPGLPPRTLRVRIPVDFELR
jgi:TonB family protein